jgi:trehalose 6-phosphate synthase/phosphatase
MAPVTEGGSPVPGSGQSKSGPSSKQDRNAPEVGSHGLVVVANRLPVDRQTNPDGSSTWQRSPGGLVSALEPVMRRNRGAWIGWTGDIVEVPEPFEADGLQLVAVEMDTEDVEDFYEGFSNATLWPLYHDVIVNPQFHRRWWEAYVRVNRRFAVAACEQAAHEAIVWVQDYQLQLVPQMVRERRPDLRIGFFNHIPFPPYEIFAQLPWRRAVLEGLLGADLLGFQRPADANNFLRACRRNGLATRRGLVRVPLEHGASPSPERPTREVRAAPFPISVDAELFDEMAARPDIQERSRQIRRELGNPDLVLLGVDRLDYTKGILHRLEAVEELFDDGSLRTPGSVLVQVATPSRERVEQYRRMRDAVEVTVGRINGDHGRIGYPAVHYLHHSCPREELIALYLAADVLLVTALRDGMNLVAKEYVASRRDERGALVLSEFAGASIELPQAFLVNPHDIDGLKAAIMQAVQVSPQEAGRRLRAMRRRVFDYDVTRWARTFLDAVAEQASGRASVPRKTFGDVASPTRVRRVVLPRETTANASVRATSRDVANAGHPEPPRAGASGGEQAAATRGLIDLGLGVLATQDGGPGGPLPDGWASRGLSHASALPPDLTHALEAFCQCKALLIGLDFDGVLAPIVARREEARAVPASHGALGELATVPGVRVALVSGRALDDLRRVAAPPPGVILIGSHGAEIERLPGGRRSPALGEAESSLLHKVAEALTAITDAHAGTHVELKPAGAVLHTRGADRGAAQKATEAALQGPATWPGVHVTEGKEVVELAVVDVDKGMALRAVREACGSEAVLYAGDDLTDERAFAVLDDDAGDVSIKVGPGESVARHRLNNPDDVAVLLWRLIELCRE